MARNIGDSSLSEYDVSPVAEDSYTTVDTAEKFIVLASVWVWEFMTSQEVNDLAGLVRRQGHPVKETSKSVV